MTYTGIDISMDYFDADLGLQGVKRFKNTAIGHAQFIKKLAADTQCIMESTGPYAWNLAEALHQAGIAFCMENAMRVKRFSQSMFYRAKTDKVDARMLTLYGEKFTPTPMPMPESYILRLRQHYTAIQGYLAERTANMNRLAAFGHMPVQDPVVRKCLKQSIAEATRQINTLQCAMRALVQEHCASIFALLISIKGIGEKTALTMITVTNAFRGFNNAKQILAFIGASPRIVQSGTSVHGRGAICKLGHGGARSIMYMCSMSAIQSNKACKALYERLRAKGKPKKVALIAVVNKLVRQMFAVVTSNTPYSTQYA
jgi:transposase